MTITADGPLTIVPGVTRSGGRIVPPAAPPAVLVWDDGTRTPVHERTAFGRNPSVAGVRAVAVRDETLSVSRTHFEIGADADGMVWVRDLGSTNGVRVRRGAHVRDLAPLQHQELRSGDILEVGDRWAKIEGVR